MTSIRHHYETLGPERFYQIHGTEYRNPHEAALRECLRWCIHEWGLDIGNVLDLACGSGEVTLEILAQGGKSTGIDPFTGDAYLARTGQHAEQMDFATIAAKGFGDRQFSLVVCSYALHLIEPSRLALLVYQLGQAAPALLVLSPNKRPNLGLADKETYRNRVHAKLYSMDGLLSSGRA